MANEYPIEELRKLVDYNPDTGKLYWKPRYLGMFSLAKNPLLQCNAWNTKYAGKEITSCSNGYYLVRINGNGFKAHRVLWALYYGEWPKEHLDHINGIKNDNRIVNLREVSYLENNKNMPLSFRNTSGHMGIIKVGKSWRARVCVDHKYIHLGYFENKEDAIAARKEAEKLYGFHENHGRVLTAAQNSVE